MNRKQFAFTLVEVVITIVIIGILASIGFFSYSPFMDQAREAGRIKDVQNINEAVNIALSSGEELIEPDNVVSTIKKFEETGETEWIEGEFGEKNFEKFKALGSMPKDPVSKTNYKYYVSKDFEFYRIEAVDEEGNLVALKTNYRKSTDNTLAFTCPANHSLISGKCVANFCSITNGTCIYDSTGAKIITCSESYELNGDSCVAITCPANHSFVSGRCVANACSVTNGTCVYDSTGTKIITCSENYELNGDSCVAITNPPVKPDGSQNFKPVSSGGKITYYVASNGKKWSLPSTEELTKEGYYDTWVTNIEDSYKQGASQYCNSLGSGWKIPSKADFEAIKTTTASPNGAYTNLPIINKNHLYWTTNTYWDYEDPTCSTKNVECMNCENQCRLYSSSPYPSHCNCSNKCDAYRACSSKSGQYGVQLYKFASKTHNVHSMHVYGFDSFYGVHNHEYYTKGYAICIKD